MWEQHALETCQPAAMPAAELREFPDRLPALTPGRETIDYGTSPTGSGGPRVELSEGYPWGYQPAQANIDYIKALYDRAEG